jgi:SAM-dependent methyltransferase
MRSDSRLDAARAYWDQAADSFDAQPDHGLSDPITRGAWAVLLRAWLPPAPATVLDVGCGTGSLSVLIATLGHRVVGIDLSPAMIARARQKAEAARQPVEYHVMDAANPQLEPRLFDVIVCRHLLWALDEPRAALERWAGLLAAAGLLILVEGFWHTGSGLHKGELAAMLPAALRVRATLAMSDNPAYWGGPVADERYAIIAERSDLTGL